MLVGLQRQPMGHVRYVTLKVQVPTTSALGYTSEMGEDSEGFVMRGSSLLVRGVCTHCSLVLLVLE